MIEPTLALYGDAFERVDRHLEELLAATGVRYCLLVDRKGFVLSHKEALWAPRPPALDSVATLVASNVAANSTWVIHHSALTSTRAIHHSALVGGYNHTVVISGEGPNKGVHIVLHPLRQVALILEELADAPPVQFSDDFSSGANALLDDLFG